MAQLIRSESLTNAWQDAIAALLAAPGGEIYDLLVESAEPSLADARVVNAVDDYLESAGLQALNRVANTIFPSRLAARCANRATLYRRYERILPRLKRLDARNRRGTYFSRIVRYPLQADGTPVNQLERVITDLQMNPDRRMRHIYEIQIFAPGKDLRPEGFPCMSSLSLHVEAGRLRLAATYRNQYFVERGLGNFMGLASLQQYVAQQAQVPSGALSLHAFHAQLDRSRRDVRDFLAKLAANQR